MYLLPAGAELVRMICNAVILHPTYVYSQNSDISSQHLAQRIATA